MTVKEFEKWTEENGTARRSGGDYLPLIQSADEPHAESYCYLREPVPVPVQAI